MYYALPVQVLGVIQRMFMELHHLNHNRLLLRGRHFIVSFLLHVNQALLTIKITIE